MTRQPSILAETHTARAEPRCSKHQALDPGDAAAASPQTNQEEHDDYEQ